MAENKKVMEEEAVDTKETKAEQTCEETNISIVLNGLIDKEQWLQGLIAEVEEKDVLPDEDEVILMYKVMKNKEIPIYADNEQIGVGIYPFVSSCAFSEDPNTSYQFDGNRLLLFASKTISKGEPLTVSMNILINSKLLLSVTDLFFKFFGQLL